MLIDIRTLNTTEWSSIIKRPPLLDATQLDTVVLPILSTIKEIGLEACYQYAQEFDQFSGACSEALRVPETLLESCYQSWDKDEKQAFELARANIDAFHRPQQQRSYQVSPQQGLVCGYKVTPLQRVGLYIPGGKTPLISTLLMTAVPATIAGCSEIIVTTPASSVHEINPSLLAGCFALGINEVWCLGGVQAIGFMAFGSSTIKPVDKIFGPGNRFVNRAKEVIQDQKICPIDMSAGPSEVLVLADDTANPAFCAADLLAQLEHGIDSQALLVTPSYSLAKETEEAIWEQVKSLSRQEILNQSLKQLKILWTSDIDQAVEVSEAYGPEHLIIQCEQTKEIFSKIKRAGSVFLGDFTPESLGDYLSGTNHVLPTGGQARYRGGLQVADFTRSLSYQSCDLETLQCFLQPLATLTHLEGLDAHYQAAAIRVQRG